MKYTKRLKIIWFSFLAIVAFVFFVQDILGHSLGMDTVIYAMLVLFLTTQLIELLKHNDGE